MHTAQADLELHCPHMAFTKRVGKGLSLAVNCFQLKDHLEKQFTSGMNWNNNTLHGWHVDHIIPLSSAKTLDDVERLCHYTNLQPLWAKDNILKSDKII